MWPTSIWQGSAGTEGILFVGRAQEKTKLFRTEKRRDANGETYPWIVPATGLVNHYYFYCVDDDFGPFFIKFCSYFPYHAKLCLNGNHWAQRQAAKAGIGFTPLDNGFAAVDNPVALQAICDNLGPEQIDALLRKWLAILPNPFSAADRAAGYRYDISILQAEFSLTQMLDKPVSGRMFFEQVIRDNLDIGRPDQVALVFNRPLMRRGPRHTPGLFRTRVITEGVTPRPARGLQAHPHQADHKEGKALRTETTINDPTDFSIGKRLTNLPALREIGFSANRRLLGVQQLSCDPITGADALEAITGTLTTATGARIPGLRLAQRRSHAPLQALLTFGCHTNGFTNHDLRELTAELRGLPPDAVTASQTTHHLRRLKSRGLITRIPHTHRYTITDRGLHTAHFLTCVHDRLLPTGLAHLADHTNAPPLQAASRAHNTASKNSATQHYSPPENNNPTQHPRFDSKTRLRPI
jgi:DNA-binding MarR family transcriptional regulator